MFALKRFNFHGELKRLPVCLDRVCVGGGVEGGGVRMCGVT